MQLFNVQFTLLALVLLSFNYFLKQHNIKVFCLFCLYLNNNNEEYNGIFLLHEVCVFWDLFAIMCSNPTLITSKLDC